MQKKYEAQYNWKKENITRVVVSLNHNTDADVIKKLETVDSKQGYIKNLIRDDIKKQ